VLMGEYPWSWITLTATDMIIGSRI